MDQKVINGLRSLSIDMINEAGSGHPGICLGAAPIIYTLFLNHLNFNPTNGNWINRDRFILSPGHGSALLYSMLFYAGYPIELGELKKFRKLGSRVSGQPELNSLIGVETTTGALGQGFATGVGMAIAEEYLRNNISEEVINHYIYVLVSDGDLMEGISYEACSLAGSLKLGKLIVLYDSNKISLDGSTKGVFDENVLARFEACGWHTLSVSDAEDIVSIDKAITKAKSISSKPSIIEIKSIIGLGTSVAGTKEAHGKPLSASDIELVKDKMKINKVPFHVSKEAVIYFREKINNRISKVYNNWVGKYNLFMAKDNASKRILLSVEKNDLNVDLKKLKINIDEEKPEELRILNSKLIDLVNDISPLFVFGSSDVSTSTKVYASKGGDFKLNKEYGKNIHFGVRESLMASACNGMALSGLRPVVGCFLSFSDYMKPGIRHTSLMNLPVTYIFTHDSIYNSEDGPTNQPVEQLGALRSIPNMIVFRPSDIKEIVGAWDYLINNKVPCSIVLPKGEFATLKETKVDKVSFGAYLVKDTELRSFATLVSTGTDLHTVLNVHSILKKKGINTKVVSVPSIELFNKQPHEYYDTLFPSGTKVIVIESSNDPIWNKFIYNEKYLLNVEDFGVCGEKEEVLSHFELDEESLTERIEKLLK